MTKHKYPYKWTLKEATFTKDKGKVFSCFACGGGSTMGYKLAGYDVLGCNEIDPVMMDAYIANHNPKYSFLEPIQDFKSREHLPDELYDLDILDGSPPCSSFSTAGNRDKDWGVEKKFREGQAMQVLDTLFFDFIDLAQRLQPKVVVAENVKGLLIGNARDYVRTIYKAFDRAGYYVQHFLLDASKMGVPQRRERVFFVALRKDLAEPFLYDVDMFKRLPKLNMQFNEPAIPFSEFYQKGIDDRPAGDGLMLDYWKKRKNGDRDFSDTTSREFNKYTCFNNRYLYNDDVPGTYTSNGSVMYLFEEYRYPNKYESCCIGSFPQDYDFRTSQYYYIIGMSVPPVMAAHVAANIHDQWLSKL